MRSIEEGYYISVLILKIDGMQLLENIIRFVKLKYWKIL